MTERAVAVVAVHGVADQQPGSSARSVADLLLRLRQGGREVYDGFREVALRMPLHPVRPAPPATAGAAATTAAEELPTAGGMNERPAYVLAELESKQAQGAAAPPPHLGRLAVDHALFEHRGDGAWRWFARAHAWAVRALTLFLPVMVLFILLTVLGLLPGALPAKPWVAVGTLAVAGLAIGGLWRFHRRSPNRLGTWFWALFPFAAAAVSAALGLLLLFFRPGGRPPPLTADQLLLLLWIAAASLAFFFVVTTFDAYRPGARRWGLRLYVPFFLLPMLWIAFAGNAGARWDDASRLALASGVLHVFELQLNLTGVVTLVFYLLALLSGLLALAVVLRAKKGQPRRRARRVAWTALATLALATVLFYTVTMALAWGALFAGRSLLPPAATGATPPHEAALDFNRDQIARALAREGEERTRPTHAEALELLLRFAATSGVTVLLFGLVLLGFLAVWGLAPAVWKEVRPPTGAAAAEPRHSTALGRWLDRTWSPPCPGSCQASR